MSEAKKPTKAESYKGLMDGFELLQGLHRGVLLTLRGRDIWGAMREMAYRDSNQYCQHAQGCADILASMAVNAQAIGQINVAETLIDDALEWAPHDPQTNQKRVDILEGQDAAADIMAQIGWTERLVKKNQLAASALGELGIKDIVRSGFWFEDGFVKIANHTKAIKSLNSVDKAQTETPAYKTAVVYTFINQIHVATANPNEIASIHACADTYLQLDATDYVIKGKLMERAKAKPLQISLCYAEALALDPACTMAWRSLHDLYVRHDAPEKAEQLMNYASQTERGPRLAAIKAPLRRTTKVPLAELRERCAL